jgi:hypothetical protein
MAVAKKSRAARKSSRATKVAAKRPAAKPAAKPVARPAAAPKAKAAVPATKPVMQPAAAPATKPEKPKKAKLVRDSFTIPKTEYAVLEALKERGARMGQPAKKSELLRAGIKLLAAQGDTAFSAALAAVPAIKTGRPAKN